MNPANNNTIHPQKDFGIYCFPRYQKAKDTKIYPYFDEHIWKRDVLVSFFYQSSSYKANAHYHGKGNHKNVHDVLVITVIATVF